MTDQETNIVIAEACGWTECALRESPMPEIMPTWLCGLSPKLKAKVHQAIPNYCHDLNAMHEAEKTLDDVGKRKYAMAIHEMTDAGATFGKGLNYWTVIHTAARQRAEAFLRTIGKWKETTI